MKKKLLYTSLLALGLSIVTTIAWAWGSWGHKHIARAAVFALPDSMRLFYYNHIDYITERAVEPDVRQSLVTDKNEGPRHFLDVEDFKINNIADFPKTYPEVLKKYDSTFLSKYGFLPWHIENLMDKLTQAFKRKNKSSILFLSSEISHYVADAHQPLHTSSNYNGQLSGQNGVHSLWESAIPPMFGDQYNFKTNPPQYISDVTNYTWKMIEQSHNLVKPLLDAEMRVRQKFDTTSMYKRDANGNRVKFYSDPVYSDAYATAFNKELGTMIEDQLRLSIYDLSCYWYTAWVNGGSPDLTQLDDPKLTTRNHKNYKREYKAWKKKGKLVNMAQNTKMD
ncbi:MAG: zinc dependent phospholipase C family protein [Bacteroidetes bacterium]|nr:zinc dependent phospholipase C family protein [Bacteroidota bacterium]